MRISVALTASCMARNSLRSCSRVWASRRSANLVIALGAMLTVALGPIRDLAEVEDEREGCDGRDEVVDEGLSDGRDCGIWSPDEVVFSSSSPPSSSPSTPNDNLPFAAGFLFFFGGNGFGSLCFDHQTYSFTQSRNLMHGVLSHAIQKLTLKWV